MAGGGGLWGRGSAYERSVGRWSSRVAPLVLDWLDLPAGLSWLDVGCGTGAFTGCSLDRTAPARVVGPSAASCAKVARCR